MRQPTNTERAIERSMFVPIVADFFITVMITVTGFAAGSLTLISEGIRSLLMLMASLYAVIILRSKHRGKLDRYQYGVDKIESFVSLVIGIGLVVSGLWVARSVVDTLVHPEPAASPLGLAVAAIVNAVNAVINILGWLGMKRAMPAAPSEVFLAQLSARFIMMSSSVYLQVTLTIAALARDPGVALIMDAIGAGFVATIMVLRGAGMLRRALPHILDAMAGRGLQDQVKQAAEKIVAPVAIARIRSRHTMDGAHAEIFVRAPDDLPASMLVRWADGIREELKGIPAKLRIDVVAEPDG